MHLVGVLRRRIGEREHERVRVRRVDDLPVRGRRRADESQLHHVDRGQRSDAVDELGARSRAEVVTQPEVHGVHEHGWGSSGTRRRLAFASEGITQSSPAPILVARRRFRRDSDLASLIPALPQVSAPPERARLRPACSSAACNRGTPTTASLTLVACRITRQPEPVLEDIGAHAPHMLGRVALVEPFDVIGDGPSDPGAVLGGLSSEPARTAERQASATRTTSERSASRAPEAGTVTGDATSHIMKGRAGCSQGRSARARSGRRRALRHKLRKDHPRTEPFSGSRCLIRRRAG